jgi:hypothetical protein
MTDAKYPDRVPGTPEYELRVRFLTAAIAALPAKAWEAIYGTLSDAQKKKPDLAAAIMADRLARCAVFVLRDQEKKADGATWS